LLLVAAAAPAVSSSLVVVVVLLLLLLLILMVVLMVLLLLVMLRRGRCHKVDAAAAPAGSSVRVGGRLGQRQARGPDAAVAVANAAIATGAPGR
jgi:hypothetical protein